MELYVLQLEGGKYYVGKTSDFNRRYTEHKNGKGSVWTSEYKPVKVVELRDLKDDYDENNTTKEYMKKYGIDNVRGGSYTQTELPSEFKKTLQAEIRGNSNACFKCGQKGHFANVCVENMIEDVDEEDVVWECDHCEEQFSTEAGCRKHQKTCGGQVDARGSTQRSYGSCYTCGRKGHWAPDCYARTHVKGYELD